MPKNPSPPKEVVNLFGKKYILISRLDGKPGYWTMNYNDLMNMKDVDEFINEAV